MGEEDSLKMANMLYKNQKAGNPIPASLKKPVCNPN
jgi:hypothetical protein